MRLVIADSRGDPVRVSDVDAGVREEVGCVVIPSIAVVRALVSRRSRPRVRRERIAEECLLRLLPSREDDLARRRGERLQNRVERGVVAPPLPQHAFALLLQSSHVPRRAEDAGDHGQGRVRLSQGEDGQSVADLARRVQTAPARFVDPRGGEQSLLVVMTQGFDRQAGQG